MRKFIMFLALFYMFFGMNMTLFAQDIYKHWNENGAEIDCTTYVYYTGMKNKKVKSLARVFLYNDTDFNQNVEYCISIELPGAPLQRKCQNGLAIPHNQWAEAIDLTATTNHDVFGSYYYKVTADITGFKNVHVEKQCVLVITKD